MTEKASTEWKPLTRRDLRTAHRWWRFVFPPIECALIIASASAAYALSDPLIAPVFAVFGLAYSALLAISMAHPEMWRARRYLWRPKAARLFEIRAWRRRADVVVIASALGAIFAAILLEVGFLAFICLLMIGFQGKAGDARASNKASAQTHNIEHEAAAT